MKKKPVTGMKDITPEEMRIRIQEWAEENKEKETKA